MKIEFVEHKWGVDITLTPESVADTAQLLRFSKNAKKQAPDIHMSFGTDTPNCYISMAKVKESVQVNSLSNKKP